MSITAYSPEIAGMKDTTGIQVEEYQVDAEISIELIKDCKRPSGSNLRQFYIVEKHRRAGDRTQFIKTERYITLHG